MKREVLLMMSPEAVWESFMLSTQLYVFFRRRHLAFLSVSPFSPSNLAALLLMFAGATSVLAAEVQRSEPVEVQRSEPMEVQRSEPMRAHDGYFREHCLNLDAGQTLEFRFVTPHPVNFNIHHHSDTDTTYPVRQQVESELAMALAVADSGEHCFMWRNLAAYPADYPIDLTYQVR